MGTQSTWGLLVVSIESCRVKALASRHLIQVSTVRVTVILATATEGIRTRTPVDPVTTTLVVVMVSTTVDPKELNHPMGHHIPLTTTTTRAQAIPGTSR